MKQLVCILLLGLIAGCISSKPITPDVGQSYIQIETQPPPFCGSCDSTTMIIHGNGVLLIEKGRWLGDYRWWRRDTHRLEITKKKIWTLTEALAPLRPSGELDLSFSDLCEEFWTDQGSTAIFWSDESGTDTLYLDSGCRMKDQRFSKRYIIEVVEGMELDIEIPEWQLAAHP